MSEKKHLSTRLTPDLIDRIKSIADADNLSIDDLLNAALDDYETRKNDPQLLSERVASLESALVDMVTSMRPDWQRTRQLTSANWDAINFFIANAANGEALKQWPQAKAKILNDVGLRKKEVPNENR